MLFQRIKADLLASLRLRHLLLSVSPWSQFYFVEALSADVDIYLALVPDATSKAAANHLTRVLAASLAHRHVTVNAIAPGVYPSKMTAYGISNPEGHEAMLRDQPTGRLGMPEGEQEPQSQV
jgi:NAD(P)-dependent dehydrogenase (short-subunit alcohol dehydrogenase family)